jgi:hypothetical protein
MDELLQRSREGAALAQNNRAIESRHLDVLASNRRTQEVLVGAIGELIKFLDGQTTKTEVVNQLKSIHTPDVERVVQALGLVDKTIRGKNVDLSPLTQALAAIHREIQTLPKEIPESKDSIEVSNLASLDRHFTSLEKTISGLKLTAEAPQVNVDVPKPEVIVQEANLIPLQKALLDVVNSVRNIKIPEPQKLDLNPVTSSLETIDESVGEVGKKIDESNKRLKALIEQPKGGGGGGGSLPFESSTGNPAHVQLTADGRIPVASGYMAPPVYDYMSVTQATTVDTYVYKLGGVGGVTLNTVTITYTDSTKQNISSIAKA